MANEPQRVTMPGQVWGLAAPDAGGPVYATSYRDDDLFTTVLTAVDLTGRVLWHREFAGHPGPPRVGGRGTAWVAHRSAAGAAVLSEVGADGALLGSTAPVHQPHERLGAFALLPDGILVLWLPAERFRPVEAGRRPRVARHGPDGGCLWSAPVVLGGLSHSGVVEARAETGWQVGQARPWNPRTIETSHWDPLLVSGERVAATFEDGGSGIAVTYFLEAATGRLVAATPPGPSHSKAIAGPGEFLIGMQGYGTLATALHDASGAVLRQWASHGLMVVDRHGAVRGPESENRLPSRSRFAALGPDGAVRHGPALSGYHTTFPAVDRDGTVVFWRDGRLAAVDRDLGLRELYAAESDDRAVMSRILLLDRGLVAFALADELLLFHSTGLGPLDTGPWPCGDGNLRANPVAYQ